MEATIHKVTWLNYVSTTEIQIRAGQKIKSESILIIKQPISIYLLCLLDFSTSNVCLSSSHCEDWVSIFLFRASASPIINDWLLEFSTSFTRSTNFLSSTFELSTKWSILPSTSLIFLSRICFNWSPVLYSLLFFFI